MNIAGLCNVATLSIVLSILVGTGTTVKASSAIDRFRNLYEELQNFKNTEDF